MRKTVLHKIIISATALTMLVVAGHVSAGTVMSIEDFKAVVAQAITAGRDVGADQAKLADVAARLADLERRIRIHNANRCIAPPDQPDACAAYDAEAAALRAEAAALEAERQQCLAALNADATRFRGLEGRLRDALILGSPAVWAAGVQACTRRPTIALATQCLVEAWDKRP